VGGGATLHESAGRCLWIFYGSCKKRGVGGSVAISRCDSIGCTGLASSALSSLPVIIVVFLFAVLAFAISLIVVVVVFVFAAGPGGTAAVRGNRR